MKLIIKLWGENGHFVAKAFLCLVLGIICAVCCKIIAPILLWLSVCFIMLGYGFVIASCWFCFKYARANAKDEE